MGKRMNLFADDDDVSASPDISKIKIDKEYARRYEYNKKREDLQRYEELKKQGRVEDSDSDSETNSESDSDTSVDVNLFNPSKKEDIDFFDKLMKVRNRDPSVYEKSKLFDSDSDDDDNDEDDENDMNDTDKKKGKKKLFLKDVVAQQLIEEGPDFEESEHDKEFKRKMSYNQEQEELRKQFLDAVRDAENGEDDGFLKMKEQDGKRDDEDEGDGEFEKKLDQYFGREDEDLDENQKFLKEFFMNKMWINKEDKKDVLDDDEVDELLQDEEEVERQEQYEGAYNFRHEENAGDRVMGHSRKVEGSVRKKDNARKEQRKSKEERMKIAEMERKEELKHLKNLKKQEMKERMRKVMEAAGIKDDNDCLLDSDDLEEDFDPDEYDKMMKKAFNDKYYEAEDVDPDFGSDHDEDGAEIEKPDFDKEDELLGLPKGWDEVNSNDGFRAARERVLMLKAKNGDNDDDDGEEEEEEEEEEIDDDEVNEKGDNEEEKTEECKRKRKRKLSMVKKVKEELMEEYYKLDYEGTVGDLKTRFKYAKVKPSSYGLKAEEILWLDDKDLNQYVSLKKIAPYREKEWQVPKAKRHLQKKKLYEVSEKPKGKKHRKKSISSKDIGETSSSNLTAEGDAKTELNVSNGGESNLSRKQKRKLKQKEYKLGHLRQIAYGQIQPKKKAKH